MGDALHRGVGPEVFSVSLVVVGCLVVKQLYNFIIILCFCLFIDFIIFTTFASSL